MKDTSDNPGFSVTRFEEFVGPCHLFHQQFQIDNQIDLAEFKHRCDWIDIANNIVTYADDLANDEYSNTIVQRAWTLYNT